MGCLLYIVFFLLISIVWALIKAGSRAAWNKLTEPADTLKKVERDSRYISRQMGFDDFESQEYMDVQRLGVCFARLAILVALADEKLEEVELFQILDFFSGAHPAYIEHIAKAIYRDLKNPDSIDWDYNFETTKKLLKKSKFEGLDAIFFDGLLSISAADGEISESELQTIIVIMLRLGWTQEKIETYIKSRFNIVDEVENEEEKISWACQVLDLDIDATIEEIKKRYRDLAKTNHPDIYAHMGTKAQELASERFKRIKDAYDILMQYKTG